MQRSHGNNGNGTNQLPSVSAVTPQENGDLAAVISHELRIPLGALMGYASMLSEGAFGPLNSDQSDTVERIDRCARELHNLLGAAFELASIDRQPIAPAMGQVDMAELTSNLAEEFRSLGAATKVRWQIAAGLPPIHTDVVRLKVVLRNLIANACKFSGGSPVTVEVRHSGAEIEFAVVEAGCSVHAEPQELIFGPDEQAEAPDADNGTGLGLYLVRRLVEKLGGTVSVESESGSGSRFCVRLSVGGRDLETEVTAWP